MDFDSKITSSIFHIDIYSANHSCPLKFTFLWTSLRFKFYLPATFLFNQGHKAKFWWKYWQILFLEVIKLLYWRLFHHTATECLFSMPVVFNDKLIAPKFCHLKWAWTYSPLVIVEVVISFKNMSLTQVPICRHPETPKMLLSVRCQWVSVTIAPSWIASGGQAR